MIKLDVRNFFTGLTARPALAKFFGETNAVARSVCGSWPSCRSPNSQELDPVECQKYIRMIMQECVYETDTHSTDELKQRLISSDAIVTKTLSIQLPPDLWCKTLSMSSCEGRSFQARHIWTHCGRIWFVLCNWLAQILDQYFTVEIRKKRWYLVHCCFCFIR